MLMKYVTMLTILRVHIRVSDGA